MQIKEDSKDVTENKGCNNHHQHHIEVVFLFLSCIFSPLVDSNIDLVVEEADDREGYQAKNQEPCPVVVPGHIGVRDPQLSHLHECFVTFISNLDFKEFRDVENYCKKCDGSNIL